MYRQFTLICAITLLVMSFRVSVSQAEAWIRIEPMGESKIGMVNGRAAAVLRNASGGCSLTNLMPVGGGLFDNVRLFVGTGPTAASTLVGSTTNFCGFSIAPLVTNGYSLHLNAWGGQGDHVLFNEGVYTATLSGGTFNDLLVDFVGVPLYGDLGENTFIGVNGTNARGYSVGSFTDIFCVVPGTSLARADGGGGFDYLCGAASQYANIEAVGCSCW